MDIAQLVKTRSTCIRRQVGSVIIKDKRILSTGYNGAPMGCKHCEEIGCLREQLNVPSGQRHELCRAVHAEQNAILQAAYAGVSLKDAEIYVTAQPCVLCAKSIINAGIRKVIFDGEYPDELAMSMLKEAGIKVVKFEK